ncbi:MAG: TlpA family protein disulfide reductase [Lachnospiraceae bacterium]|nr:TlpA family protein disulfide reductase [Lachnospiraceae bacterium]
MEKQDETNVNTENQKTASSKPIGLIITLVALVVLIAGASILYKKLGDDVDVSQLKTEATTSEATDNTTSTADKQENAQTGTESAGAEAQDSEELTTAPDITFYDLEGNAHKLSDFRGKPVVMNFWSSNCGPCKGEMPEFEEMYKQYGDEVQFLMVNVTDGYWDTLESASTFIEDSGYTFPVYYDTDNNAAYVYGVSALPTTFFLDEEGYGVAYAMGAIDMDTLIKGIDMITK